MAKSKGKEKPATSNEPDVEDANAEPTPSDTVKIEEVTETTVDGEHNQPEDVEINQEEAKNEEEAEKEDVKEEAGTVEAATNAVIPKDENAEEGDKKEEAKGDKKVESGSDKKSRRNKNKNKSVAANAATSDDAETPETPATDKKGLKKADGMGLIFMCSAKTKHDCYNYKVLGLPASKKEMVSKIYKGMRLFLYDIDLRLLYGVYKASSPGGYNLEPKAFKSAFPSQVRFTVLDDCLPLPEEKFKAAIKENYYEKNKFNVQLSSEQVKNLCKLFRKAPSSSRGPPLRSLTHSGRSFPRGPREAYILPPPRPYWLDQPPAASYAYHRPADNPYYRREVREPPRQLTDPRYMEIDPRLPERVEYRDPNTIYREPVPQREALYPGRSSAIYDPHLHTEPVPQPEASYPASLPSAYAPSLDWVYRSSRI